MAQGPADRFVAEAPALAETLSSVPPCTDYHRGAQTFLTPRSLDALFAAMEQHPKAILLAGGTDLGLRVSKDREALPAVIALQAVEELRHVTTGADALEIGGAVTYSEALPHLDQAFSVLRRAGAPHRLAPDPQPRNHRRQSRHCLADRRHHSLPDRARCQRALASRAGERVMPVEAFITGYRKTALAAGEIIAAVRIPFLAPGQKFSVYKLSKRFDQDISTVIAAFRLDATAARCENCARPMAAWRRARCGRQARSGRHGRPWAPAWLADIETLLARDFTPIGDHRGGAAYRLRAAAGLLRRFQLETSSNVPVRVEAL